jgi:predicted ATP-grasp superfamily ATP-dependent carboligase
MPAYVLGLTNAGLGVVRSLAHARIPVVGVDSWAHSVGCSSRLCSLRICPAASQPKELLEFFLAERRQSSSPGVIIFAKDEFTVFASRHRQQLAPYYRFVLPEEHVSEAMVDKQAQYEVAKHLGIPYPQIETVRTMDDVLNIRTTIEYPVLIKPVHSHLWRKHYTEKVFTAGGADELINRCRDILSHKLELILQSFVPGPVSNIRICCAYISQSGAVLGSHVVQKIRQYPPVFGEAAMAVTVDDPQVHELGLKFALGAGYRGPCNVEFKRDDRNNTWKLMELNPRFWNYTSLGPSAGSDLPLLNYLDAAGQNPAPRPGFKVGVHWLHTGKDIQWFNEFGAREGVRLVPWLWSWRKARSYGAFAWNDILPWWRQTRPLLQPLRRTVFDRSRSRYSSERSDSTT